MSTIYPRGIDTELQLPVTTGTTKVDPDVVNRLRAAILAIEKELGIRPSSTYGTVRTRLDTLEASGGGSGGGSTTFGGDLATVTAITQKVIGLQTKPIASTVPLLGQGLIYDGTNWSPRNSFGVPSAATQANWYINATSGNDNNNGLTSATALKTHAEMMRRIGTQQVNPPIDVTVGAGVVRIFILEDIPNTDPIQGEWNLAQDVAVHYIGGVKTVNATGSFTAVTAKNPATNTPLQCTDSALSGGWAAHVGQRVRITTAGDRLNSCMWVAKNLGAGAARMSDLSLVSLLNPVESYPGFPGANFLAFGMTTKTPIVGDTYAIETLYQVTIGPLSIRAVGSGVNIQIGQIVFSQIEFREPDGQAADQFNLRASAGQVLLSTILCKIKPAISPSAFNFYYSSNDYWDLGSIMTGGTAFWVNKQGGLTNSGATISGGQYGIMANCPLFLTFDTMVQGGGIKGTNLHITSACVFDAADVSENRGGHAVHIGLIILDMKPGTEGPPGFGGFGAFFQTDPNTRLWGSGNVGYGINIAAGSTFSYKEGFPPTITGTLGDFSLAGSARAWDEVSASYTNAKATTWANLALAIASGGFGGSAHNIQNDAHLVMNPNADAAPTTPPPRRDTRVGFANTTNTDSNTFIAAATFNFNKATIPPANGATRTMKVRVLAQTTSPLMSIRLYNVTTATVVTGGDLSTSSTTPVELITGDLTANLSNSAAYYEVQIKMAAGSPTDRVILGYAALEVEWT